MIRTKLRLGLTLIEVMISMAILAILVVVVSSATLVLKGATVESNIGVGMEATARRVLTECRRELRSSGFKRSGAPQFQILDAAGAPVPDDTPGVSIVFRKRLGPEETDDSPTGWSEQITYTRIPDPEPYKGIQPLPNRFILRQIRGSLSIPVARDVSDLTFTRVAGDGTILVRLELTHNNPHWAGSTSPPAITRVYEDQIQMLNRAPTP